MGELAKMVTVVAEVSEAVGLTVSEEQTDTVMVTPTRGAKVETFRIEFAG